MKEAPDCIASQNDPEVTDHYEYLLLTVKEAAEVLQLTEQAVLERVARGTLPATKLCRIRYVRLAVV